VFDRKAYITMYVVRKTRSVLDRNLICFIITPLQQLNSPIFLAAHIHVKIRIEEGQNIVRAIHQKTTKTQPAHWQVYYCDWCALTWMATACWVYTTINSILGWGGGATWKR